MPKIQKLSIQKVKENFKQEHLGRPLIKSFYHPLSINISYFCIKNGISANMINAIGVFANIFAAIIILISTSWIGYFITGLLVIFAFTTDLCDGTIARYYSQKNMYGKWSDEIAGLIGATVLFSAGMFKVFLTNGDIWIMLLGVLALSGFMMMNFAAILSELIRNRFPSDNLAENTRKKLASKLGGINPNLFAFSFDVQWTLIALGVMFNQFYLLFAIFGVFSNLQWLARYYIYFGK